MEVSGVCIIFKCTEGYKKLLLHLYQIYVVQEMKELDKAMPTLLSVVSCVY